MLAQRLMAAAGVSSQPAYLLDALVGAPAFAYSLRKLKSTATRAINVQRSSDSTTQDIGFTSSGNLDTTSLAAFVGSATGYIKIWYDQSGNGNDTTSVSSAYYPSIVISGTLQTLNGLPCGIFNTTQGNLYKLSPVNVPLGTSARFINAVAQENGVGMSGGIIGYGTLANYNAFYLDLYAGALTPDGFNSKITGPATTASPAVFGATLDTATTGRVILNGVVTSSTFPSALNTTAGAIYINDANSNFTQNQKMAEAICIAGNSSADINKIQQSQGTYYGISVSTV